MQSFQDFLRSRREQAAGSNEDNVLKRSRSYAQPSSLPLDASSALHRSKSSRTSTANLSHSKAATTLGAAAAAAAGSHTTTTVLGSGPSSGRYLSSSSTAAHSGHKLSDGLAASLRQLISPQRSAAALSSSSSLKQRVNTTATPPASKQAAAAPPGGITVALDSAHTAPAAASTAAGFAVPSTEDLRQYNSSSRLGALAGSSNHSRLQPLSVQDALHSPLAHSTAATPTGARTPTGGRRYAAAGGSGDVTAGAAPAGAAASSGWSEERSAMAVLQEVAARAAALSRNTTMRSHASRAAEQQGSMQAPQRDLHLRQQQPVRGAATSSAEGLQPSQLALGSPQQQWQRQGQEQQQQQPPHGWQWQQPDVQLSGELSSQPTTQLEQMQLPTPELPPGSAQQLLQQQQQQQQHQQQAQQAAVLLVDLDRRFAAIKDSFKGLASPTANSPPVHAAVTAGHAALPGTDAGVRSKAFGRSAYLQPADPYSLHGSSGSSSSDSSSSSGDDEDLPVASPGMYSQAYCTQQRQQQQLLSPADTSPCSSSESASGGAASPTRQPSHHALKRQQSKARQQGSPVRVPGAASAAPQQRRQAAGNWGAQVVQGAGLGQGNSASDTQHVPDKSSAVAAAAAVAAATAAAAAAVDGSMPFEVDVKCGEEQELMGATAHFVLTPHHHGCEPEAAGQPCSPGSRSHGSGGSSPLKQQVRHKHKSSKAHHEPPYKHHQQHQQQQLPKGAALQPPGVCGLSSAQVSGMTLQSLSPSATTPDNAAFNSQRSSSSSLGAELWGPQPRSRKPQPSITQKQWLGLKGLKWLNGLSGTNSKEAAAADGGDGGGVRGGAAAVVAAAGQGVLDGEGGRWRNNALLLAKQEASELQQQNDALVRVLDRERQQHTRTRQQLSDLKLELQEARTEWEVKLQALRLEKAAALAQLRRAMVQAGQQDLLDAFESELAASAARAQEAQAAAARLASQVAEMELQLQELQVICNSTANGAKGGSATATKQGLTGDTSRADNAAVVRAVASAERRSPEKQRSPCRAAAAATATPDAGGGRGLRALRQHQLHLEQQLAKQNDELSRLQRDKIKLLRLKKQYDVAASSLQAASGAKSAAEAFAQEAGLRAAAASGRADRLELQVDELQRELQQLKADRDRLHLQLEIAQQQQRLQASLSNNSSKSCAILAAGADPAVPGVLNQALTGSASTPPWQGLPAGSASASATRCAGAGLTDMPCSAVSARAPAAAAAAWPGPQPGPSQLGRQRQHTTCDSGPGGMAASATSGAVASMQLPPVQSASALSMTAQQALPRGAAAGVAAAMTSSSASAWEPCNTVPVSATAGAHLQQGGPPLSAAAGAVLPATSAAEQAALSAVAQLQMALPNAGAVQGQLASLMSAIQAGVQERQALTAQGQVLLEMLVGGS